MLVRGGRQPAASPSAGAAPLTSAPARAALGRVTSPVPGGVGAGPALLRPPLVQGCLLSLAQVTEAGRTHELQPAKSPHGQRCACVWQLQTRHPGHTRTHAAGAAAARAVPSGCCAKEKLQKKGERTGLYGAHLCQQENKPLIRSTLTSPTGVNNFSSPFKK